MAVGTYGYIGVFKGTFSLKKDSSFASFSPHALKGQKLLAQGNGHKQHALKGQKLLAQGNALGIKAASKAPCKGKSLKTPGIF